ncbi:MAG: hypothetical protein FJX76_06955 [Armatimonadetes bacterium]|nr:hypothetical protein [Armatimonadota bacterium]
MGVQIGIDVASSGVRRVAVERRSNRFTVLPALSSKDGFTVAAAPAATLTFRLLAFPFADRRKLEPLVAQELEHTLAFPLSEAAWDFVARPPREDAPENVFAVACPRSRLDQALEPLDGQAPDQVDAEPFAYQRVLNLAGISDALVVDLAATHTTFCRIRAGSIDYVRVLLHGMRALAAQVAASRGIRAEQATENILRKGIELPEVRGFFERQVSDAMLPPLAAECNVYLCGGGMQTPGLAVWLGDRLGRQVLHVPMPDGLLAERDVVALGMALHGLKGGEGVSLQTRVAAGRPPLVTAGIWILLCLALIAVDLRVHELTLRRQVNSYDQAIKRVAVEAAPEVVSSKVPLDVLRSLVASRKGRRGGGGLDAIALIQKVAEARQAGGGDAKVWRIGAGEGTLRLQGEVSSFEQVAGLRKVLSSLGKVTEETRGTGGRLAFTMTVTLEPDRAANRGEQAVKTEMASAVPTRASKDAP